MARIVWILALYLFKHTKCKLDLSYCLIIFLHSQDSTGGGDRISEFGFRMHENPSEEEEDDEEDDEVPDFENIDPEAG